MPEDIEVRAENCEEERQAHRFGYLIQSHSKHSTDGAIRYQCGECLSAAKATFDQNMVQVCFVRHKWRLAFQGAPDHGADHIDQGHGHQPQGGHRFDCGVVTL